MKNKERYGLPEIYKFFKKKFTRDERNSSAFLDYKKFSAILKDSNKKLSSLIIDEAIEFKMPLRLGFVRIKKYKKSPHINDDGTVDKKGLSIDWPSSKSLWNREYPGKTKEELKEIRKKPLVYFLNEHTDGYGFMLYWSKKGSNAVNRSLYSLVFTFSNNRHLAKVLQGERKIDYYE
ncbi:MAG: hypothetical protein UR43_C0015G0017 [candidate division TM6 bacterium GW2011_GWF2_33_332]|nr:MAG: hypothetical protein UR43_C0015G0017 [candidate division TM6 bacterium GW2011_GWF2_33_332]